MTPILEDPPVRELGELDTDHVRIDELEEHAERADIREGLSMLLSFLAAGAALTAIALVIVFNSGDDQQVVTQAPAGTEPAAATPTLGHDNSTRATPFDGKVEEYERPDPTLPAPPAGDVKKFRLDVYEHVTKVSADKPATRVWSYAVNGKFNRGTGVSEPMVVTQGDKVEITLVNGASKEMDVRMPHSIDYHSSEIAPNEAFKTIDPGETHKFSFVAKHPGVFMYHCATDPVLMHTGAGMVGMMVVKPQGLAPVDRELWMTQQEFYIGEEGQDADPVKMAEKNPDVLAFNGYGAQYKEHPIEVTRGETIRMYVLNAGPSIWSAFHVIGTVFDTTHVEGVVGHDAQTINLAPSQGGWVEFTLDEEGSYPFVTHAFGDMVKGAVGVLATENAPSAMEH
jgi:nitrite reductase (NO-forming)